MVKRILGGILALLLITVGSALLWYFNRPLPKPIINQAIFRGVTYSRYVDDEIPLVYHIISIDLTEPTVRFFTTPAGDVDGFDYAARTTSGFLEEFDLQVAINGDFFDPWYAYSPFDYYPKVGEGVNARGLAINEGMFTSNGYAPDHSATLYMTEENQVSFTRPDTAIETAISGNVTIVEEGAYSIAETNAYLKNRHPRTAIAINQAGDTMMLFVVDGRQPNYSHGVSMPELAEIIIQNGGYTALNLDGGGSVSMAMEMNNGQAHLLNSPIHTRIPYQERPVANHFGVFAEAIRND